MCAMYLWYGLRGHPTGFEVIVDHIKENFGLGIHRNHRLAICNIYSKLCLQNLRCSHIYLFDQVCRYRRFYPFFQIAIIYDDYYRLDLYQIIKTFGVDLLTFTRFCDVECPTKLSRTHFVWDTLESIHEKTKTVDGHYIEDGPMHYM